MAKLQELISSTTGIPAPPSEEVIQESIQEAQRALYEDQWQNLCSLGYASAGRTIEEFLI